VDVVQPSPWSQTDCVTIDGLAVATKRSSKVGATKGSEVESGLVEEAVDEPRQYCIRLGQVFTGAISWPMLRLARLAGTSTGFSSGA
jgi:hypothetical protein